MTKHWLIGVTITTTLGLNACSSLIPSSDIIPFVYRIDVQQGNVVTQNELAQLEVGMDKNKVRLIMGTPMIVDVFHQNRWDYLYTYQKGVSEREQRRISLFFKGDNLSHIKGDIKQAHGKIRVQPHKEVTVIVPQVQESSLLGQIGETIGLANSPQEELEKNAKAAAAKAKETLSNDPSNATSGVLEEAASEENPTSSSTTSSDYSLITKPSEESDAGDASGMQVLDSVNQK